MFTITVVLAALTLFSFIIGRLKPTKRWRRILDIIAGISFLLTITSGVLGCRANIKIEDQLRLTRDQASEAIVQADRSQAQIADIRTPRRMEPEIKRMLAVRLKQYAGQKYDMKVFRDHDSIELARAIQSILEEAGWVYTNVYPRQAARYAETRDDGVWLMSGKVETRRTSEARIALHGALNEAGLYDDTNAFTPKYCVESTSPVQEGTKIKRIPCSESSIQSIKIVFTFHDDVIPEDTLVLHIGKERR
ncbi:MAG: hypothetical protein OXQ31_23585 [Spirochaetaceae bacterium]|nr:hypothetical protein [Spirochaetaceae bacterium]